MTKNNQGFLNVFIAIALSFALIGMGAFGLYLYQQNFTNKSQNISITPTTIITPTTEILPTSTIIPSSVPTVKKISDEDLLKKAFAKKYFKNIEDVILTISKTNGKYISGGVSFQGEMGGAWFLAYKKSDDEIIIVDDGNGTISCEKTDPYGFPKSMLPECWSETENKLIKK